MTRGVWLLGSRSLLSNGGAFVVRDLRQSHGAVLIPGSCARGRSASTRANYWPETVPLVQATGTAMRQVAHALHCEGLHRFQSPVRTARLACRIQGPGVSKIPGVTAIRVRHVRVQRGREVPDYSSVLALSASRIGHPERIIVRQVMKTIQATALQNGRRSVGCKDRSKFLSGADQQAPGGFLSL